MYFWNIEKLKEDIVAERFSEKDRFAYVMSIRFLALLVPIITAPIFYYMYAFRGESAVLMIVTTPLEVIVFLAWLVFLYVRICKHIGDVKSS